jgi:hypothetical protein
MRLMIVAMTLALTASLAHAADATCEVKAADKKLAGAAKNSFVKKCEKDAAKSTCATTAADKKLAGAAKNSFIKKCEKDAAAGAASAASK